MIEKPFAVLEFLLVVYGRCDTSSEFVRIFADRADTKTLCFAERREKKNNRTHCEITTEAEDWRDVAIDVSNAVREKFGPFSRRINRTVRIACQ